MNPIARQLHEIKSEAARLHVDLYPMFKAGIITQDELTGYVLRLDGITIKSVEYLIADREDRP